MKNYSHSYIYTLLPNPNKSLYFLPKRIVFIGLNLPYLYLKIHLIKKIMKNNKKKVLIINFRWYDMTINL